MNDVITREVDNRTLILALDYLYRENMKIFEVEKLLPASQALISHLSIKIVDVPIEGYYNESEDLKAYFLNCKSLQMQEIEEKYKVINMDEYALLSNVISSEIYGSGRYEGFFTKRLDPLYYALMDTFPNDWNIQSLTEKAHLISVDNDDNSLVGLGAYIKDSVVLAALRETVALYGVIALGCAMEQPTYKYIWAVDKNLEEKVNQFIKTFNELTSSSISEAKAENAEYFYNAFEDNHIMGRCINIGFDDSKQPIEYYHWAIKPEASGLKVDDFWDPEIWTTERYQNERLLQ